MAFNSDGNRARDRVRAITKETFSPDPYDKATIYEAYGRETRIGFHPEMIDYIYNRDRKYLDKTYWITCPYCDWDYDISTGRTNIDHQIPWNKYSRSLVEGNPPNTLGMRKLEVYIGCNDPSNLIVACKSCNESKRERQASPLWIQERRALADKLGGFK